MKQLTCEMCGGTDLIKQNGVFVCQNCGCKYSIEEAKKMMIEGTVDVQGTVKVDVSDKVKNLYIMARRAKDDDNAELASKYYEMITFENPHDWESLFYFNYFKAEQTKLRNMANSVICLANSLDSVFDLIDKSDKTIDEKWNIAKEIITKIDTLCESYIYWAKSHYREYSQLDNTVVTLAGQTTAIAELQKNMADLLEKYFAENSTQIVVSYLKSYVDNYLLLDTLDKVYVNEILKHHSNKLIKAEEKIKALDPSYVPLINANTQSVSATNQNANTQSGSATNQNSNSSMEVNSLTGEDFYCPLIGYILWALLAGIIFFVVVIPRIDSVPFLAFLLLIIFLCPCVLLIRLIIKKIKSKK